MNFLSLFNQ